MIPYLFSRSDINVRTFGKTRKGIKRIFSFNLKKNPQFTHSISSSVSIMAMQSFKAVAPIEKTERDDEGV